ncbi:MAG TPA: phage major capsid protein [Phycisphaerae bacterium]|nr:phage major capsid protein [Phycisphaerae bacterium]
MKTLKIKYVSGTKKDQTIDLPEDVAKGIIESEAAVAVSENPELDAAVAMIQKNIDEQLEAAATKMTAKLADQINKAYKDRPNIVIGRDLSLDDPKSGFRNLGEFAQSVRKHYTGKGTDERLKKMWAIYKADGMDETNLADGGALVPQEFASQLYRDVLAESLLFDKARKYPINLGNTLFIPVRSMTELGATAAGGGSLGTWLNADGVQITPQKPVYNRVQMNLNRWGTLLPVTDELLADNNVALSNFIFDEGGIALAWDLNSAFISGSGNGQPQGILNSGALITASSAEGQAPYSITYPNLVSMKTQLWTPRPGDFTNVAWIAHPDAEAQFEQLEDTAGRNLYYAAGTIQQSPNPRLFGLPVIWSYHCSPVGHHGDIILADLSQYFVSTKASGPLETAMSMHFYFDSAEVAYRILYRIDGKTARTEPLEIPNGANSRSGFVTLAARVPGGGPDS